MKIAECKFCQEIGDITEGPRSEREWDLIWLHRYTKHREETGLFRAAPAINASPDLIVDHAIENLRAKLIGVI